LAKLPEESACYLFFSNTRNLKPVLERRHSAPETTAAEARIEAPDAVAAHEVDVNAEKAHDAAEHAASFAKVRTILKYLH